MKIILVDDNPAVRQFIREVLRGDSTCDIVAEVGDGITAVEEARRTKPDVVVMDVRIPRLDGIEATKRIKDHLPQTAVVAVSAFTDSSLRKAMEEAGSSAFVAKEFLIDLPDIIKRLVTNKLHRTLP